jgi:hypothetical protein
MQLDKRRADKTRFFALGRSGGASSLQIAWRRDYPVHQIWDVDELSSFSRSARRYKTSYGKSIYALVPTNYFTVSPTVNVYGAEFGTDKIAHFFQQGYDYYKIYNRASKAAQRRRSDEKCDSLGADDRADILRNARFGRLFQRRFVRQFRRD